MAIIGVISKNRGGIYVLVICAFFIKPIEKTKNKKPFFRAVFLPNNKTEYAVAA